MPSPPPFPSPPSHQVDYLILGQGLAGTNLAFALLELGQKILLIDAGHEQAASRVAAGLLNPVTGPRLRLTWQATQHLEAARAFYRKREEELGISFYQERPIWRFMATEAEAHRWAQRKADPAYDDFLGILHPPGTQIPGLRSAQYGVCEIPRAAAIEPAPYLQAARQWFQDRGLLWARQLPPTALKIQADGVWWEQVSAEAVVFCQGSHVAENPWFGHLPFQPAKGEILEIEIKTPAPQQVISFQKWLVPLGRRRLRLGSTFAWDTLDWAPTEAARRELLTKARQILPAGAAPVVLRQDAGVRPCSHDTKPYLGRHPAHPRAVVCNGFGSKGALTTPLCTQRLARHLVLGEALDEEENLLRVGTVPWAPVILPV